MLECSWERQGALRGAWVFHCVTIPRWGKISTAERQRWLFLFVSLLGLMRKCGGRCFRNSAALILEKKQKQRFSSVNSWYLMPLMSRKKEAFRADKSDGTPTSGVSKGGTAAPMLLDTQRWLTLKWGFFKGPVQDVWNHLETLDHWVHHSVRERFLNL